MQLRRRSLHLGLAASNPVAVWVSHDRPANRRVETHGAKHSTGRMGYRRTQTPTFDMSGSRGGGLRKAKNEMMACSRPAGASPL